MFESFKVESTLSQARRSTIVAAICFAVFSGFGESESFAQKPYDASTQNIFYRFDGSEPEIVGVPNGDGSVDVAWHDHSQGESRTIYIDRLKNGVLTRLATIAPAGGPQGQSYGRLAGYVKDEGGNHYVLTGKSEKITPSDKSYVRRPNILGLIKLGNNDNRLVWQKDLNATDTPKYLQQPVYGPMRAGTARLAYGQVKSQTNLALGKKAELSSLLKGLKDGRGMDVLLEAKNAVDGIIPIDDTIRLAHTDRENHPYLTIDLGAVQSISDIVVHGRSSVELKDYELRVTDSKPTISTLAERKAFLTANPPTFKPEAWKDRVQLSSPSSGRPVSGRYVTIMMPSETRLILYELQVFAPKVDEPLLYIHYMTSDGQWDNNIGPLDMVTKKPLGDRHQHSNWCLVNATTGLPHAGKAFGRGSEGHSFDVRTIFDNKSQQFVALEVSDGSFAATLDQPLRHTHDNHYGDGVSAIAHTRPFASGNDHYIELGGLAMVGNEYLALFTTRASKDQGPYLMATKTKPDFWSKNNALEKKQNPSTNLDLPWAKPQNVNYAAKGLTNIWPANFGACRPKLVSLSPDSFVVLFEHWENGKFEKTRQIHIDGSLNISSPQPNNLGVPVQRGQEPSPRLHRGDDAFALGGKAAWVTGAGEGPNATLTLNQVGADGVYSGISFKIPPR